MKIIGKLTKFIANKTSTSLNRSVVDLSEHNLKRLEHSDLRDFISVFQGEKAVIGDDLIQKFEMCDDTFIKNGILDALHIYRKSPTKEKIKLMTEVEDMLDAINVANKKYTPLFKSGTSNFSEPRKAYKLLSKSNSVNLDAFQKSSHINSIKNCIFKYPRAHELHDYLYENYYLTNLMNNGVDASIVNRLTNINKKYGTKLFFNDITPETKLSLDYIEKELEIWYQRSNGKAKFPNMIDVNEFNSYFLQDNKKYSNGYFSSLSNVVSIRGAKNTTTIRHEMVHCQDEKLGNKPVKFTSEEKQQLKLAGVTKDHIKYGETAERESIAIALDEEANSSVYSNSFAKKLMDRGLPQYTIGMPQHGQNFMEQFLRVSIQNENTNWVVDKVKNSFNGKLSEAVIDFILYCDKNGKFIEFIKKQYELHPDLKFKSDNSFIIYFIKKMVVSGITSKINNLKNKFNIPKFHTSNEVSF